MGVDALGERATGLHLLAVFLHKVLKVLFRSPLCIVNNAGTVCASVQRRPDHTGLSRDLLDEANSLIDQFLLLFRFRLKDIDHCHQITLAGNTHLFPPLESSMLLQEPVVWSSWVGILSVLLAIVLLMRNVSQTSQEKTTSHPGGNGMSLGPRSARDNLSENGNSLAQRVRSSGWRCLAALQRHVARAEFARQHYSADADQQVQRLD